MTGHALPWRIERSLRTAWPALSHVTYGNWLFRFSEGLTRRANSANPLQDPQAGFDTVISIAENLYRERGLPAIFRIPSFISAETERRLDQRGYAPEAETSVRHAEIAALSASESHEVKLTPRPTGEWLAALASLQRQTKEENQTYARIVGLIEAPAMFAAIKDQGRIIAVAYATADDRILCHNSVATHTDYRGRGYARSILLALAAWATRVGAKGACLPVEADNIAGRALYDSIGLKQELYRYRYWREPPVV